MTPRERAHELLVWSEGFTRGLTWEQKIDHIERAITAAVAKETERAAKVAETAPVSIWKDGDGERALRPRDEQADRQGAREHRRRHPPPGAERAMNFMPNRGKRSPLDVGVKQGPNGLNRNRSPLPAILPDDMRAKVFRLAQIAGVPAASIVRSCIAFAIDRPDFKRKVMPGAER